MAGGYAATPDGLPTNFDCPDVSRPSVTIITIRDKQFTRPPERPHDPATLFFNFDQPDYYHRVPGEFTCRLTGEQCGFESLPFFFTGTHPGGGPGLHVHETEEANTVSKNSIFQMYGGAGKNSLI